MKIRNTIFIAILYTIILGTINIYSVAISHGSDYLFLPYLIDPITYFAINIDWLKINKLFEIMIFIPIFWPIMIYLLVKMRNKNNS